MQYFGFDKTLGQMRTFGFGVLKWLPTQLFQNNEQGAWYDPSDLSSLFQDAAMTIPVTANGDPVGAMMDLSGNGNHATQSVSASRPTYQTDGILHWLAFDGVDDYLFNSAFTGIVAQPYSISIALNASPIETTYIFDVENPRVYCFVSTDGVLTLNAGSTVAPIVPLDEPFVFSFIANAGNSLFYVNNVNQSIGNAGPNSVNSFYIGARYSGQANLRHKFYGAVIAGNSDERVKEYLAKKSGVTLWAYTITEWP